MRRNFRLTQWKAQIASTVPSNAIYKTLLLASLLMLMASCAAMKMYPGERLPRDKVARIQKTTTHFYGVYAEHLNIVWVDGARPTADEIDVLPGEHTLRVGLSSTQPVLAFPIVALRKKVIITPPTLTFQAVAGREYRIDGKRVPDEKYERWVVWVEDVETGAAVGGRKPDLTDLTKERTESDWLETCHRARAPHDRIDACTALIDSGKLKPMELSSVLVLRADAYLGLDLYNLAISDADQALRLNPEQVWAYIHRGTAYKRSRHFDLAIADFDQALRLAPPTSEGARGRAAGFALGHRGAAYSMKGEFHRAIPDHIESNRLVPNWWANFDGLCWDRAAIGELDQALADCNEALRLSPGNPSALDSRAFVYMKIGRLADAIQDYDAALAKRPNQVNSLYGRGRAKQMAGIDPAGAERDIATALRLRPSAAEDFARRGIPQH